MNPIKQLITEQQAKGGTVISVFADSTNVGILVRHQDGSESAHEVAGSDLVQNRKWAAEASLLLRSPLP